MGYPAPDFLPFRVLHSGMWVPRLVVRAAHKLIQSPACRREYDQRRRTLLPILDPLARKAGRPLTKDKTDKVNELIATVSKNTFTLCRIETALVQSGYERALATLKHHDELGVERTTWAKHDGPTEHHIYIFGDTDTWYIYGHLEDSYLDDPTGHQDGADQLDGDPTDEFKPVLHDLRRD